jgi:ABC-type multidrug transport system ATPase subunit
VSELLGLEHVALGSSGSTLSLSVRAGESIAVMGPGGAGKSRLLRLLAGLERPGQGRVHLRGTVAVALGDPLPRKAKVQNLARSDSMQEVTEALLDLGLFEVRQVPFAEVEGSRSVACEILGPLVSKTDLAIFDGQLDGLDPWVLHRVEERLRQQRAAGRAVVFATHRPDLASRADGVIVLREGQVRFAGSVDDLLRTGPPHSLHVETDRGAAVRSLVEPFEVEVRPNGSSIRLEAKEGQALAARLLLEGYGDIRYVVMRSPTFEEALRRL